MRKNSPNCGVLVVFILLIIVVPNVLGSVFYGLCPDTDRGTGRAGTTFNCPSGSRRANTTALWPEKKEGYDSCGDADKAYTNMPCTERQEECHQHLVEACCDGASREEGCFFALLGVLSTVCLPCGLVGALIAYFCNKRKAIDQGVQQLYTDWKGKGIAVQRIPSGKHHRGALCFILPSNMVMMQQPNMQQYSGSVQMVQATPMQATPMQQAMPMQQPIQPMQRQPIQPMQQQPIQPIQPMQPMTVQPIQAQQLVSVTVPSGAQGGQTLEMNVQGRVVRSQIPMGMQPGQNFQIQV